MEIKNLTMPDHVPSDDEYNKANSVSFTDTKKIVCDTMANYVKQLESIEKENHEAYMKSINTTLQMANDVFESITARISPTWFLDTGKLLEGFYKSIEKIFDYPNLAEERKRIQEQNEEIMRYVLVESKWIPTNRINLTQTEMNKVFEILDSTRDGSKSREKRIDAIVFRYMIKKRVAEIKKDWQKSSEPSYIKRILSNAIDAYERKQYALTISSLVMLWDRIIYRKYRDESRRKTKTFINHTHDLLEENNIHDQVMYYFDEYVIYDCQTEESYKENTPSRHAFVHGFYTNYPSRKIALNAILFTDLIVRCKPIQGQ